MITGIKWSRKMKTENRALFLVHGVRVTLIRTVSVERYRGKNGFSKERKENN